LTNIVVKEPAICLYGPGTAYQNKGTRRVAGSQVDLLGRIETDKGTWVQIESSPPSTDTSDPCWLDAAHLTITGEQLKSVPPVDPLTYILPYNDYSLYRRLAEPAVQGVVRTSSGDRATVSWEYFDVGDGEVQHPLNVARYIVEAWVCRNGQIVFSPKGYWLDPAQPAQTGDIVGLSIEDQPGCTQPSHARLYLQWVNGFVGPVEIQNWPQSTTVLTPAP
jgi:hypothetical protein